MSFTHESTVTKAWEHDLEAGGKLVCFTLDEVSGAFSGDSDWLPLLTEAIELHTRVRVKASAPKPEPCGDPLCGDGCCDDPDCTNVPEEQREQPFLLRCDSIQWL